MAHQTRIEEENRPNYFCDYQPPPDNPLPLEWNKNPEENPLIMLFNNPWITTYDLMDSGAYNQPYSWEVDMKKEYLLENLKLENGILFPFWWTGTGKEFAAKFNEDHGGKGGYLVQASLHERPFVVLEILLSISVEPLSTPREPDYGLWD